MNELIVKIGKVISVVDDADGLRIKAQLNEENNASIDKIPYAFPLLPKVFQSVPKLGEGVLIILSKIENIKSNRYYIGPIISQPQKFYQDTYTTLSNTTSLLKNQATLPPYEKISNYPETEGAFPKINDVAIIGRKGEDIILKDDEIDLRCGIRQAAAKNGDKNLIGNVIFNKINPAYIQLKYRKSIGYSRGQEADSVINLVSDKINLISHKDVNAFNLTDKEALIPEKVNEDLDSIMSRLHQVPYGDVLIEVLNVFRDAILNHFHRYPGEYPVVFGEVEKLSSTNLTKMLSDNVRIS